MSLSLEALHEADKAWRQMSNRLFDLLGFVPASSDHYGIIRMYNIEIGSKTSDEELLKINSDFLKWKEEIIGMFAEKKIVLDKKLWEAMSSDDLMFGMTYFLGIAVDIYSGVDKYREVLEKLLDPSAKLNGIQMGYKEKLKWALA